MAISSREAANEAADTAADIASDDEVEEFSENSQDPGSDVGGDTTDEEDGEPFAADEDNVVMPLPQEITFVIGKPIAHRWDTGWHVGIVQRQIELSDDTVHNGQYAVKYPDSVREHLHDLFPEDYGSKRMWVMLERHQ